MSERVSGNPRGSEFRPAVRPLAAAVILWSCLAPCAELHAAVTEFFAPANAGIVDVRAYGAAPDDGKDDTSAIQTALNAFPAGHAIIYLPNGVYQVSDTLRWPQGVNEGQIAKYTTLQGHSTDGVVLQLPDASPGFMDPKAPKAMVFTGPGPAQRFGNQVRNLTIHTGKGNPGAIGLQFNASNYGCVRDVKIISGDGQGSIGLDMSYVGEIGPLLVKNLLVSGFDYGIKTQENEASQTLECIRLEKQNKVGIYNLRQSVFIRNLRSRNAVPAVWNATDSGQVVLTDSVLTGVGDAARQPAIIHDKKTYTFVRNVTTEGYQTAIGGDDGEGVLVGGPAVTEWTSEPVKHLFSSSGHSLNLPVKETPVVPLDPDLSHWADVRDYGAVPGDQGDDTAAIQKAVDSGKTTVWLPTGTGDGKGEFIVNGTLHVRGKVERLIGFTGRLNGSGTVSFEDGDAPVVVAERIAFGFFGNVRVDVATKRTVVIMDGSVDKGITHTGSGELFIENVVVGKCTFQGGPVYARQLNPEVPGVHVLVDGARVWISGMKVEVKGTIIEARNHAVVEMLGLFVYASHRLDGSPMLIIDNSSMSANFREKTNYETSYPIVVREIRGQEVREWTNKGGGSAAPLYCGVPPTKSVAPKTPTAPAARALSPSEVSIAWTDQAGDEDGFRIERKLPGGGWVEVGVAGVDATSFVDAPLPLDSDVEYRVRAYNVGGSSQPTDVVATRTLPNTTPPTAPASTVALTPQSGQVVLTWQDQSNNEEQFQIQRRRNTGEWADLKRIPANTARYVDKDVQDGVAYAYRVCAVNSMGASAFADPVTISTLPAGWQSSDLNVPMIVGSSSYDAASGNYTLKAGGQGVWGNADQCHLLHRELAGDFTLTARIPSLKGGGYYASAGLIARASESPDSILAYIAIKSDNFANFVYRTGKGAPAGQHQGLDTGPAIKWLRLVRSGTAVAGLYATAEKPADADWKQLGPVITVPFEDKVIVGLAACAEGEGMTATAVFEGLSIGPKARVSLRPAAAAPAAIAETDSPPKSRPTPAAVARPPAGKLPEGWTSLDIGNPELAGHSGYDAASGTFSVTGGGADIWAGSDQFQFLCRDAVGDARLIARLADIGDSGTFSKTGIMFRDGVAADAPFAAVFAKPDGQLNFTWRASTGANADQGGWLAEAAGATCIKLVRSKGDVAAFYSANGKTWVQIGEPRKVALSTTFKAGLAVCATSRTLSNTSTFAETLLECEPRIR